MSYSTASPPKKANHIHPGEWLNPRRRHNAAEIVRYLNWHGRRLFLDSNAYVSISDECRLSRVETDLAIDDLFTLGIIEMHRAGDSYTVTLLDSCLEVLA